jgi:hypothetical protein
MHDAFGRAWPCGARAWSNKADHLMTILQDGLHRRPPDGAGCAKDADALSACGAVRHVIDCRKIWCHMRTDTARPCIMESDTACKRWGQGMEPCPLDLGFQVDPKLATLFSTSR